MNQQEVSGWVGNQLVPQKGGELATKDILLVLLLLDDSGSIRTSGNTQAVIDGYNGFIEALKKAPGEIRVKTMFLNGYGRRYIPFQSPNEVEAMTPQTYIPAGGTPLFPRSLEALNQVNCEAGLLALQGSIVRTMTFIFTDGGDTSSMNALRVRAAVSPMLASGVHIVGGCAVNDGYTNFWQVFASMGIPEHWIKVLKNDPDEIAQTMSTMGQTASEASIDPGSYRQSSQTGFGGNDGTKK